MNPQGFVKQEPMPEFFWRLGRVVANAWRSVFQVSINDFEGYMIAVTSCLVILSVVTWVILDIGNERDRREAEEASTTPLRPSQRQPAHAPQPEAPGAAVGGSGGDHRRSEADLRKAATLGRRSSPSGHPQLPGGGSLAYRAEGSQHGGLLMEQG